MNNHIENSKVKACPVCACAAGAYSLAVGQYMISKCSNCGLEYTSPNPSDDELNLFYSHYADIRADSEITALNATQNLDFMRSLGLNEQSYILDFGCGNGEFVKIAGDRCFGVELSAAKEGERVFSHIDALPITQYDFITLWGVLEHVNDPMQVLKDLSKILKKGGRIVLTTVDAEGPIPYYYKPPEHLTYWSAKAIHCLFEQNAFAVKLIQPYTMLQFSEIYLDRLLSRTPEGYREHILSSAINLPKIIKIPTNEFLVVAELMMDPL